MRLVLFLPASGKSCDTCRNSDIDDMDPAQKRVSPTGGKSRFGGDKGCRMVGHDSRSACQAGIRVETARKIDAQHGHVLFASGIDGFDDRIQGKTGFPDRPRSEQTIDNPAFRGKYLRQPGRFQNDRRYHAAAFQNMLVGKRIPRKAFLRSKQPDTNVVSPVVKVSCNDKAIPAVVAGTATQKDRAVDSEPFQQIRTTATGIFHQHQAVETELFHRNTIDKPGLFAGQGIHFDKNFRLCRTTFQETLAGLVIAVSFSFTS